MKKILCVLVAVMAVGYVSCDFESDGGFSSLVAGFTSKDVLKAPYNVKVSADADGGIRVTWDGTEDADGYTVYRSPGGDSRFIRRGSASAVTYVDSGASVPPDTPFYYRVSAYNGKETSAPSQAAGPALAKQDVRILEAPEITDAVPSGSSITIRWTAVAGADGYILYRASAYDNDVFIFRITANSPFYTDDGLAKGAYVYQVRAINSAGEGYVSRPSDHVNISTGSSLSVPAKPRNLRASLESASGAVVVSWDAAANANSYAVYRSVDDEVYTKIADNISSAVYRDMGAENGAAYFYRVRGYNGTQEGYMSDSAGPVLLPPGKPDINVVVKGMSAAVEWADVYGADRYHVYRSIDGSRFELLTDRGITGTSYTDPGLAVGTYYYRVEASNAAGAGLPSQHRQAVVSSNAAIPTITGHPVGSAYLPNVPASPLTVRASVNDGGSLTYQWYRNDTDSNVGGSLILGAASASYTPPTNASGTVYYYVIVTNTNNTVSGSRTAEAVSNAAKVEVAARIVSLSAIAGVTVPALGGTPVTTITETEQYTGTAAWAGNPATFAAATAYTAAITLTAKSGYTLQGVAQNFFTVAGAAATNAANSGVVTAVFPATGAEVITIAAIQGVTAPATGETPVTTITENAQYSGTVTWNGNPATFVAATQYTATITLTAKSGFTLQGMTANFFTVEGATATNQANSGVITAVFPATGAVVINIDDIQGITPPVTGGTPVAAITANVQYSGTVTWNGNPATFAASTQYTATITLTAKSGFTLTGVSVNFFKVAGATSVSNSANSGVITAVFPATAAPSATAVNIAAIQGVTAPATGGTPVTTITENAQYMGIVSWNGNPSTFAAATQYTATITLTAKTGYTLQGVAANFFTVAGATSVSNQANSGVITAIFPATNPAVITIAAIQGVTAPETGGTPVRVITESAQYTGTVTWNGNPATFAAATAYTATITLAAKSGFTLQGVAENSFTVAGAVSVSNQANSGVITAVFPATAAASIAIEMVYVPGGSFQMGDVKNEGEDWEKPVHTVTLTGFYMSKYQVTQEQYQAVMGINPSYFHGGLGREPANGEVQGKRPVEMVSWYDAIEFCNALSVKEGLSPYYSIDKANKDPNNTNSYDDLKWTVTRNSAANGYRLPTEAQWEYAAKGGNGTPGNYTFSGSNTAGDVAWYYDNSNNRTHEVGKKQPNGLGLYDMSGNVWEWCWDWKGGYSSSAQTDPVGPSFDGLRVVRGGGWAIITRSASREFTYPIGRFNSLGYRLVRP